MRYQLLVFGISDLVLAMLLNIGGQNVFDWLKALNWTEIGVIGTFIAWSGRRMVKSLKMFIKGEFDYHRETIDKKYYPREIAEERHIGYNRRLDHLENTPHRPPV
jgi:hypothetical protein